MTLCKKNYNQTVKCTDGNRIKFGEKRHYIKRKSNTQFKKGKNGSRLCIKNNAKHERLKLYFYTIEIKINVKLEVCTKQKQHPEMKDKVFSRLSLECSL